MSDSNSANVNSWIIGHAGAVVNEQLPRSGVAQMEGVISSLQQAASVATSGATTTSATKYDTGKTPFELLPAPALEAIAEVLEFGRKKYASWNWAKGFTWSRLIGAALRHLFAFARGEDRDPESGLSHLAHAGCCILFLITHERCRLGTDDRYKLPTGEK